MKKDKLIIPKGDYCYSRDENGNQVNCPYWSSRPDKPNQENGYCAYLEEGDWEVNADSEEYDPKTGEVRELRWPCNLLWDQVKECGINPWTDEDWERMEKSGKVTVMVIDKPLDIPEDCPIIRRKPKDEKQL